MRTLSAETHTSAADDFDVFVETLLLQRPFERIACCIASAGDAAGGRAVQHTVPESALSLQFFLAQLIRGPLFALGAVFLAQAVKASRRQLALWLGFLLFVIGGVAPYVEVTFRTMPLGFNLATLTEILLQNFLTGVVAAYLFGTKQAIVKAS